MPMRHVASLVRHFSFQGFFIKVSRSSFGMILRSPRFKGFCLRLTRRGDSDLASEDIKEEPNGTVSPAGGVSVQKIRFVLCIPR
jgi:hypothetical protein